MRCVLGLAALGALALGMGAAPRALAQGSERPNGVFLVAKPSIRDPNFSQTVVLVTQTPDAHTVGVIVNRPTPLKLSQFYSDALPTQNYKDRIYFGGPVMRQAIVAVFQAQAPPPAAAFHVLPKLYLTMHQDNVERLLAGTGVRYRLYAGFSGWLPGQLERELERDGWYVVPADEEAVFREDPGGLWKELHDKASRAQAKASASVLAATP